MYENYKLIRKCVLKSRKWRTGMSDVSVTLMLHFQFMFMSTRPWYWALTVCFVHAGTATAQLSSTISNSAQEQTQRIFKSDIQLPLFYLPLCVCGSSINSWVRKYFHRTNRIQTRARPSWRQMCPRLRTEIRANVSVDCV